MGSTLAFDSVPAVAAGKGYLIFSERFTLQTFHHELRHHIDYRHGIYSNSFTSGETIYTEFYTKICGQLQESKQPYVGDEWINQEPGSHFPRKQNWDGNRSYNMYSAMEDKAET